MALIAGDHLGAGVLIGSHHLAQFLRVESAGEDGGVHQVTEQHGELAAFRFWGTRGGYWGFDGGCSIDLGRRPLHRLRRWRSRCCGAASATHPDEHVPVLVHGHALGSDELIFQHVKVLVIQLELKPQRSVCDPPSLLEERYDLIE
jgi:hypothetical protein